MKTYELTYLISPEISEEEVKEFQNKVASFIQEEGGVLGEESLIFKKNLAYPIKNPTVPTQQTQAYLAVLNFQLNQEKLTNLEKKLKTENKILRYLLLTKKEPKIRIRVPRIPIISKKPGRIILEKEKKVELEEIEKKLEEILNEPK